MGAFLGNRGPSNRRSSGSERRARGADGRVATAPCGVQAKYAPTIPVRGKPSTFPRSFTGIGTAQSFGLVRARMDWIRYAVMRTGARTMWGALAVLAGVAAWQGRSYLAGTEAPGEPGTVAAGSAGAADGSGPRGNLGIPSRPGNDPQERPGATWDLEDDPIPATIARSLDARRALPRPRSKPWPSGSTSSIFPPRPACPTPTRARAIPGCRAGPVAPTSRCAPSPRAATRWTPSS